MSKKHANEQLQEELNEVIEESEISDETTEAEAEVSDSEKEKNEIAEVVAKLNQECQEYKDKYVRAHAEMENLRRRTQTELEKSAKYAVSDFAKNMLSIADNLSRAMSVITDDHKQDTGIKTFYEGIEMTQKELLNVFDRYGVTPIEALNQPFNPNLHQAVQEIDDPSKPTGTVVQEFQTGYMISDRVLRPSMVVTSKGGPKSDDFGKPNGCKIDTSA